MLEGFTAGKPWAAAIIGSILGPVISMCYINRGRIAVAYFVIYILLAGLPFIIAHMGILPVHPVDAFYLVSWTLIIIGAIHCFRIAKNHAYPKPFKWYSRWYALLAIIVALLLIVFAVRQFFYQTFEIPNSSMSPNVNNGDYLFAHKFAYNTQNPARGDVIIIEINNKSYIKRVAGLPGDRIQIKDSILYINDLAVPRKGIEDYSIQGAHGKRVVHQFTETLPEGREYNILVESKNDALDNTLLYTIAANHYFVLGDNRDQSHDSRDQDEFGFVPQKNVIGKASVIFWNEKTRQLKWEPAN